MPHELRLSGADVADDATLTLGSHPDGELSFEEGTATVADETLARRLAERYVRLEYVGDAGGDESAGPDDTDGDESVTPPVDPAEYTIDDLAVHLDAEAYSAAELQALLDAEVAGKDREGAMDVIEAALEE